MSLRVPHLASTFEPQIQLVEFQVKIGLQGEHIPHLVNASRFFESLGEMRESEVLQRGHGAGSIMRLND